MHINGHYIDLDSILVPFLIVFSGLFALIAAFALMDFERLTADYDELTVTNEKLTRLQDVVSKTAAYNQARYSSCEVDYNNDVDYLISYIQAMGAELIALGDNHYAVCSGDNSTCQYSRPADPP
jgi:hypothetical protein